ncbi:DinB family protein [Flavobacteriaceae bacterium R38]|nr:DinB family protein [Flavobacteriaceae bacterium R38]
MKNYLLLILTILSMKTSAQEEPISAFIEKWENSKNYLLEIMELMPESKYDFKPVKQEMSFREQLSHIRGNIVWLGNTHFSEKEFIRKRLSFEGYSKKAIIEEVIKNFNEIKVLVENTNANSLKNKVDFFAGPKTKLQILNLLQDHVTHHRGQLIVYLNLNNIQPPEYVGW